MNKRKIIFYAPVGKNIPDYLLGGGEIGCRRTREILSVNGYEVITIDKPTLSDGKKSYIVNGCIAYTCVLKNLLINKNCILYTVGFYEKNIYLEWLILITGKILNHPTVYEARNGRLVRAYYEYKTIYKSLMRMVINSSDIIFCQGQEYIEFIKKNFNKEAIYTPNYVLNRNLSNYLPERSEGILKIIYVGRVTQSKNIELIIDVMYELTKRDYNTQLIIIGSYTEEYKSILDAYISKLKIPVQKIKFLGKQDFEIIKEELKDSHFFIFPSQEIKEGHSNALTEAMTYGVVPIASNVGFNKSIIGKNELIVDDYDVNRFVAIIDTIVSKGLWQQYSMYVYERVKQNFTEDIVKKNIISALKNL